MLQHSFDFSTGTATNLDLLTSPGHLLLSRGAPATFSRNSPATKKDGSSVAAGAVRYETGIFGTAAMVEEGKSNLSPALVANQNVTITTLPDRWKRCTANQSDSTPGVTFAGGYLDVTAYAGKMMSISVEARTSGASPAPYLFCSGYRADNSSVLLITPNVYLSPAKGRIAKTVTIPADVIKIRSGLIWYLPQLNDWFEWRDWQIEGTPYATSAIPETGTRSPELLALPATGLTPTQGTIEMMVYVDAMARRQGGYNYVFGIPRATDGVSLGLGIWHSSNTAEWKVETSNDAGTSTITTFQDSLTPDGWHRFAARWNGRIIEAFIDGAKVATYINANLPSAFHSFLSIGSKINGFYYLNTLFDDIRLSSVARSDAELAASWNTVLPWDPFTTAKYRMDADLFPDYVNGGNWVGVFDTTKVIAAWRQLAISTLNTAGVHYSARSSFDGVTWGGYHHDSLPERGRYIELTIGLSALNEGDTSPDVTGAVLDWVGPASRDPLIRAKEATYSVRAKIPGYDN